MAEGLFPSLLHGDGRHNWLEITTLNKYPLPFRKSSKDSSLRIRLDGGEQVWTV